jgi:hypothetical protein
MSRIIRARAKNIIRSSLGPLETLPSPFWPGAGGALPSLYTTGALLRSARTVNDLVVRSEEREISGARCASARLNAGQYQPADLPEMDLDPVLLALLGDGANWAKRRAVKINHCSV